MMIEEGKFYRTRDGRKVGPMARSGSGWADAKTWQFDHHGNRWEDCPQLWNDDGVVLLRDEPWDEVDDLIAEWTEGPVRTVTRTMTETTIEAGTYGRVEVLRREGNLAVIGLVKNSISKADSWTGLTSTELKAAAAVLLELAGALDSDQ